MASLWNLYREDSSENDALLGRELAGEEGMPPKTEAQVDDILRSSLFFDIIYEEIGTLLVIKRMSFLLLFYFFLHY